MWMWSTGINRNIVECKVIWISKLNRYHLVLIETLWNVKDLLVCTFSPVSGY